VPSLSIWHLSALNKKYRPKIISASAKSPMAAFALIGAAFGLLPGPVHSGLTRRSALALASSLPAVFLGRLAHADGEITSATCKAECFKECNMVAPGNQGYCATQCDSYCDEAAKAGPVETGLPPQADLDKNL
jgi:hypothetical protein